MFCPDGVVDIPEACGAFNPGSNPGRDAFNTENWTKKQLWLVNSYRICLLSAKRISRECCDDQNRLIYWVSDSRITTRRAKIVTAQSLDSIII